MDVENQSGGGGVDDIEPELPSRSKKKKETKQQIHKRFSSRKQLQPVKAKKKIKQAE